MARASGHRGEVIAFDGHVGIGTVRDIDDQVAWNFHCTAILDGTRMIEVGTPVRFEVAPRHGGRREATSIEKLDGSRD